jgi:energy-coupling factor transporter transmembrane protein EcfT
MVLMHSGVLIVLWLLGVAGLQFLGYAWLLTVVALCGVAVAVYAPQRGMRLIKRIRFLLLAIIVLFAGFTPGEAILIDWPQLSPSREGVRLAIEHAARVLAVVFCVAILMERLSAQRLVGALYALLRPFESIGFPAGRVAVRTLLVLRLVDAPAPPGWRAWLKDDANDDHERILIVREPIRVTDIAALLLGVTVVAWLVIGV